MTVPELKLFELLKAKIGIQETEAFVEIMETSINNKFEKESVEFATKADIHRLEVAMIEHKADLMKWLFGGMIATAIALLGALTAIMKSLIENALQQL